MRIDVKSAVKDSLTTRDAAWFDCYRNADSSNFCLLTGLGDSYLTLAQLPSPLFYLQNALRSPLRSGNPLSARQKLSSRWLLEPVGSGVGEKPTAQ